MSFSFLSKKTLSEKDKRSLINDMDAFLHACIKNMKDNSQEEANHPHLTIGELFPTNLLDKNNLMRAVLHYSLFTDIFTAFSHHVFTPSRLQQTLKFLVSSHLPRSKEEWKFLKKEKKVGNYRQELLEEGLQLLSAHLRASSLPETALQLIESRKKETARITIYIEDNVQFIEVKNKKQHSFILPYHSYINYSTLELLNNKIRIKNHQDELFIFVKSMTIKKLDQISNQELVKLNKISIEQLKESISDKELNPIIVIFDV